MNKKPLILCILDGWGIHDPTDHNAITLASTPCMDELTASYPNSMLETSGASVGLPIGQMGNSEVGHMNIGSGRIIIQDLPRINNAIEDKAILSNQNLKNFISNIKGNCHLMGLISDGGVHSHQNHLIFLANHLASLGIKVFIHMFSDGRDTSPQWIIDNINNIEQQLHHPNISIATISGRYYAMDRDNRWDRTKLSYEAIVNANGNKAEDASELIADSYSKSRFDEFITPTILGDYDGFKENDAMIMTNFRTDRAKQLLTALVDPDFNNFERKFLMSNVLGMVAYSDKLSQLIPAIFEPIITNNILPEILSNNNLTQLRIAETEKFPHVTFFFNCGKEEEYEGEKRILIASPNVATYDLSPAMSANIVTDEIIKSLDNNAFDVIIVNYANTDMVGHTGSLKETIEAVEVIDNCVTRLKNKICEKNGILIVTSDHGNAEEMLNLENNLPHTSHTTNKVPFIIYGPFLNKQNMILRDNGQLSDIAPTILDILKLEKPVSMTGHSLITLQKF